MWQIGCIFFISLSFIKSILSKLKIRILQHKLICFAAFNPIWTESLCWIVDIMTALVHLLGVCYIHIGSVHVSHLFSSSMVVILGWHPPMEESSMDDIHRWHFSIHGWHFSIHWWHPRMALSFMDEVSPSMDDIQGWHFYPWMRFAHSWKELSSITFC